MTKLRPVAASLLFLLSTLPIGIAASQTQEPAGTEASVQVQAPASEQARQLALLLEPILLGESDTVHNQVLGSIDLLSRFYQNRQFEPLWLDKDYARSVISLLGDAAKEGLSPADYHVSALNELYQKVSQSGWRGDDLFTLELLLTDGVITYGSHLLNGKVNPALVDRTWNYDEVSINFDTLARELDRHVKEQSLDKALESLTPQYQPYKELKQHLQRMQTLADSEPFSVIPLDATIRKGASASSLDEIAKRLSQLGYLDNIPAEQPLTLSGELFEAVKRFQAHHALKADGIIGKGTMAAMNVSFADRADQIRINLERARWLSADLSPDFLIVNLAGYQLRLFKQNQLNWETDIIIGKVSSKTPLFKSKLKYMVANPTWTVPRSISREIIWHLKKDPNYLEKKNFVLRTASGAPANSHGIDWQTVNPRSFPYWFVQQPSANNALGQIKFIFPNAHSIYLHDTPSKSLFSQEDRAFSHGCIRVKDPLVLADKLMASAPNWTPDTLQRHLATGETKQIFLNEPLDILIMYWTAESRAGELYFYKDIYKRDDSLVKALKAPRTARLYAANDNAQ
ncbi:L,D-transpeptidase family protein [Shewanella sp. JM162201]|uniref:L,D-transpeptidase family protein n=1 Tax=Shewanella jiangmenensis TaxID=2837387 RepID=A0ABS5V7E8_9GAMM|nr:L,D-transpeptidase family protein [Shewanella jiangmenensis]MBT1444958.1 L,D-transpeptidase family protein [Shewanella jiangmenensis]